MVNPNAARHLALVVGVLLCFFVYMGYHIKTKRAIESNLEDPGIETAALPSSSDSLPLMTMRGPSATEGSATTDETRGGSDVSFPLASVPPPSEESGASALSGDNGGLLAMADSIGQGDASPPAAGSFEESLLGDDVITGLTAAAPALPGSSEPPAATSFLTGQEASALSSAPVPATPADDFLPAGMTPPAAPAQSSPVTPLPPAPLLVPPPDAAIPAPAPIPAPATPVASQQTEWNEPAAVPATLSRGEEDASDSESIRSYIIRPGDTLSRIATRELGSIALADNIYLLNRDIIFDPDQLTVGTKIRLPVRESVAPGPGPGVGASSPPLPAASVGMHPGPALPPRQAVAPALPEGSQTYKIRRGDTLSSIALQFYGSSSGWQFLYQSNPTTIPNPDQLTVGTEIVIPPYGNNF